MNDLKSLYARATKLQKKLEDLTGDDYYKMQEQLQDVLRSILTLSFKHLTKRQLFNLLRMCSSHRPYAPHILLAAFANEAIT